MKKISIKSEAEKSRKRFSLKHARIISFCSMLSAGLIISFLIPLRPTYSQSEKRELSAFPVFGIQSLFDGSYFKGIDLWFSDTFPFREQLVTLNGSIRKLYGTNTVQVQGVFEEGDDIPDVPVTFAETTATEPVTAEPAASETAAPTVETTAEPAVPLETQTFGAMLVVGDAAFEYYNFRIDMANRYAAMINKISSKLDGSAALYDMIVPTGMGITLPESMRNSVNSSDQSKAVSYMYGSMDSRVKTVNLYDTLTAHKSEYIYFRTDHHWTADGAYYGYEKFAEIKGIAADPLSKYEKFSFDGYLGSFYTETNKNPALGNNPDTVVAYKPYNATSMAFTNSKGSQVAWEVITDVSGWSAGTKYNTFIGGDNPYTIITNKDLADNSSCLVVKESFGNALIPFLVAHYQNIHVIDYRYWKGNLIDFIGANKIQDVLFINNISATRSEPLIKQMEAVTG